MKVLVFADLHSSITRLKKLEKKAKAKKPDYIFCLGDFTIFEQNVEEVMHRINALPAPVYLFHGNHEEGVIVKKLAKKFKNITYCHGDLIELNGYTFVCYGGLADFIYGDKHEDAGFEKFIKKNKKKLEKKKLILMVHAPPYKTKLDYIDYIDSYVGCTSYTDFIKKYKPVYVFAGHIHEGFNKTDKIGKSKLINPGPDGKLLTL